MMVADTPTTGADVASPRADGGEARHGVERPPRQAVVLASGGLDSTVLAFWLHARGTRVTLLSFDYGQRHGVELDYARAIATLLDTHHEVADLHAIGSLLSGSALTDPAVAVPDGHYTDDTLAATVVPNRNAILLSIAVAVAVARGSDAVAFAAHAGDHPIYPDCREPFIDSFSRTVALANEGYLAKDFRVFAPFSTQYKSDLVRLGAALGVPFEQTWSCYRGGDVQCGRCGTCVERHDAFRQAGVPDPTHYEVR